MADADASPGAAVAEPAQALAQAPALAGDAADPAPADPSCGTPPAPATGTEHAASEGQADDCAGAAAAAAAASEQAPSAEPAAEESGANQSAGEADLARDAEGPAAEEPREERAGVFEARLKTADERRAAGNEHFKLGEWAEALSLYEKGLWHCEFDEMQYNFELLDQHRELVDKTRVPLLLNAAACALKLDAPKKAIPWCDEALKLTPGSSKALFRRGQARQQIGDLDRAKSDLAEAARLQPGDALVRKALASVAEGLRAEKRRDRDRWQGVLAGSGPAEKAQDAAVDAASTPIIGEAEEGQEVAGRPDGAAAGGTAKESACWRFVTAVFPFLAAGAKAKAA